MKIATTALAAGLALLWTADAFAASRKHRYRDDRGYQQYRYDSRGGNTVAANGLCQRDTGTPNSRLSFRNKCDVEEFWARQQRGGGRR